MKRRMVYTTKEGVVEAMEFVYENAESNTVKSLAEKLEVKYGAVNALIKAMRRAGIGVKTAGRSSCVSMYKEAATELKERLGL